jgi:gluconolactonase
MPEVVANLNWGGNDGKTLFITASSSVYRIDLKITGVRPH